MGGSVILIATIIPTLLWADCRNEYMWLVTGILVTFGLIGYFNDIRKLRGLHGKGMPGRTKLILEIGCALTVSVLVYAKGTFATQLTIPLFKHATPDLGLFYIAVCVLIIVGTSKPSTDERSRRPRHRPCDHRVRDVPALRLSRGKHKVCPVP